MDISFQASECGAYVYDENVIDFLVKYDNNLAGVMQIIQPDCVTIINSQFLVAYRNLYDESGEMLSSNRVFQAGYDSIPKCFGLMDTSGPRSIGVGPVQGLPGLSLSGKDVLIGFVDTGIDYANPLFLKKDGSSRVAAIWDQTEEAYLASEDLRPVFGYGREYTNEMINRALQSGDPYSMISSRDEIGHGTFLASVACGSAYAQGEDIFTGVAQDSDIIMVKLKQAKKRLRDYFLIKEGVPCYSEVDIVFGVKYLINKAMELKKPLVICLGIGSSQGDHNGNLNLELYLDTIVTLTGICVVGSAGNELGSGGHFSSLQTINPGSQNRDASSLSRTVKNEMEVYVEDGNPGFYMEIWGKAPSLYRIAVTSPTGERFDRLMPNQDSSGIITYLYEGTTLYAENIVIENNSGDPFILLRFEKPTSGIWTMEVTESYNSYPNGYDAWLPIRQFLYGSTRFSRPDPEVILCAPANARGTITVSGYNHYDNSLYINSSRGFTRKGRIQPDFAAPAVDVQGAFAGGNPKNPLFVRKSGTSIAAAFTAGAAAMLLEWGIVQGNRYALNTEVIRQILIRGTRTVADVTYPNPSWGWGVLDVGKAFEMMRTGSLEKA